MPDTVLGLALFLVGLLPGLVLAYALHRRASRQLAERQERLESAARDAYESVRLAETLKVREQELALAREEIVALRERMAGKEAEAVAREQAMAKEREAMTALRGELESKFRELAQETFKASQKSFLELAEESFKRHKGEAATDLEKRREAIASLLKPMEESLKRFGEHVNAIEKARHEAYGTISSELRNVIETQAGVRAETARLVNALRAQPKTRGRWGEHQLQRVMELAGMSEHVDYTTQEGVSDEDGRRLVPDAIIRLPGERSIVIDAKTSLSAYFDAMDAVEENAREVCLNEHARQIRTHVKQLGAKAYWEQFPESPDFVAMFIPGENFYAAAIERDPELFDEAIRNRVLIVTPTTLIALAKAVAYGWRQEAIAQNAREVAALGGELYKRLGVMGEHVARMGKALSSSVSAYNSMIGSLEQKVLPQARRFEDLKVDEGARRLETLEPLDIETRALNARELLGPADSGRDSGRE
ncbi:MAG: DNA recombination protein RmuC [Rhodothalassiaceae bacterium]